MKTVPINYGTDAPGDERINPELVRGTGEPAQPTSRVLDGSQDHGYAEEWTEPATLPDGRSCEMVYLFDTDDITDDDGEPLEADFYPWDAEHVRRIRLTD